MNHRIVQLRKLRREIEEYSRRKKDEMGLPNWVVIGDAGGDRLVVDVIENSDGGGLEYAFTNSVMTATEQRAGEAHGRRSGSGVVLLWRE